MATRVSFTKQFIEGLEPPKSGRLTVYDSRVRGLCLLVTAAGTKTAYVYRKVNGKPVRALVAKWPDMTVDQIRTRAEEINNQFAHGENPTDERRQMREGWTLKKLFDHWLEFHAKPHKKTWQDDERQFNKYLAKFHNRKLGEITKGDVQAWHSKLGKDHGPYQANRALALLRSVYNKADDGGYEGANPAARVKPFKEKSRDRFLQPDELPRFFAAVNGEPNETLRDFFLLALFTGARRSNVASMKWEDVDLEQAVWRIPETKAGRVQHVSLASPALVILQRRKETANGSEYVLPSYGKRGHIVEVKSAWQRITTAAGLKDLRPHDLRRTLGSYMAIQGASLAIIGATLGHSTPTATKVYARLTDSAVTEVVTKAVAFIEQTAKPKKKPQRGRKTG